jgi:DNA polymerase III alpha subunit (gram-positive type)
MKFLKDILLFHVDTTGPLLDKDPIIQLSAVLLDKDNLLEKNHFHSYVRTSLLDGTLKVHADQLGVSFETMRQSPKIVEVLKKFETTCGTDVMLACHQLTTLEFLKQAFKKAALTFPFEPHVLELWTLGYIYTLHYGLKKLPTYQTFLQHFGLIAERPLYGLERVRLSAEIFRRIIQAS